MLISDLENEIVARLNDKIKTIPTEPYPEKPETFTLKHKTGTVLVHYAGSNYGKLLSTDPIVQERRTSWGLIVVMRNLRRGNDGAALGAYAALDAVRIAITGWKPSGGKKAIPVKDGFEDENGGIWQYALTVEIPVMAVEVADDEVLPLLKRLTALDDISNQTTEVT